MISVFQHNRHKAYVVTISARRAIIECLARVRRYSHPTYIVEFDKRSNIGNILYFVIIQHDLVQRAICTDVTS